jgi:phage repressor protein C with HTH and peptisase S24 domain
MLAKKMAEVLSYLKEQGQIGSNSTFVIAAGMGGGDRLKNILGGKLKKLTDQETQSIQLAYGVRAAWWTNDKAPMLLTDSERRITPTLNDVRLATADVVGLGLPEQETSDLQSLLFLMRTKNSDELIKQLRQMRQTDRAGFIYVQRYDVQASAGHGSVVNEEAVVDRLAFKRDWIRRLGLDPSFLALIDVRGDSMSPTIDSGDILLLDTRSDHVGSEGVYVINLNGPLLVKRLRIRISGAIEIISDNPKYGSEEISGEELSSLIIVGRVVWHGRAF